MRIVVVEDHEALREVTVAALREMGHEVLGVASAEALEASLASAKPNILVLDLGLPGEDGVSLARRLRQSHPEIGIIMVTARTEFADRLQGYASGADIYLPKPTRIEELGAAIESLSRRIVHWAQAHPGAAIDPGEVKAQERARAIHQQLLNTRGKLPTLDELSAQYGCSVRRLNEEFAARYGAAIYPYVTEHRLQQAHALVANTRIPLKTLAGQLGYSYVNHFNAAFKRRFGYPPGELRKRSG